MDRSRNIASVRSNVPMSTSRDAAYAEDWEAISTPPTTEVLLREIDFYERRAREVLESEPPEQGWKHSLYRDHASHRRKLLAAVRDGHPEAWVNYPD